jgi:glutamate carboxypeptidase
VVAAQATAEIDVRVWTTAEAERLEQAILGVQPVAPGIALEVNGGFKRPPMERNPATGALFERAREIGVRLGLDLQEGSTGGGSDGNFSAALGIPTLDGLGAPGGGAHAEDEHILIDSLPQRAALLTALLLQL